MRGKGASPGTVPLGAGGERLLCPAPLLPGSVRKLQEMSVDLGLWVSKLLDLSKGEKKKKNQSGKQEQKRKATLFIFAWLNLGVSGHEQKKPNVLARGSLRA